MPKKNVIRWLSDVKAEVCTEYCIKCSDTGLYGTDFFYKQKKYFSTTASEEKLDVAGDIPSQRIELPGRVLQNTLSLWGI